MKKFFLIFLALTCLSRITWAENIQFKVTCNGGTKVVDYDDSFIRISIGGIEQYVQSGLATFNLERGKTYDCAVHNRWWQVYAKTIRIPDSGAGPIELDLGWETLFTITYSDGTPVDGMRITVWNDDKTYPVADQYTLGEGTTLCYLQSGNYKYDLHHMRIPLPQPTTFNFSVAGDDQEITQVLSSDYKKVKFLFGNDTDIHVSLDVANNNRTAYCHFWGRLEEELYLYPGTWTYTLSGNCPNESGSFIVTGVDNEIIDLTSIHSFRKVTFDPSDPYEYMFYIYDKVTNEMILSGAQYNSPHFYISPGEYKYKLHVVNLNPSGFSKTGYLTVTDVPEQMLTVDWGNLYPVEFYVINNKGAYFPYAGIMIPIGNEGDQAWAWGEEEVDYWNARKGKASLVLPAGTYTATISTGVNGENKRNETFTVVPSNEIQKYTYVYNTNMVSGRLTDKDGNGIYGSMAICKVTEENSVKKIGKFELVTLNPDGTFVKELAAGKYYFQGRGHTLGFLNGYYKDGLTAGQMFPVNWGNATLVDISQDYDHINISLLRPNEVPAGEVTVGGKVEYTDGLGKSAKSIEAVKARPVAYATVILYGKAKSKATFEDDFLPIATADVDESTGNFSFAQLLPKDYIYRLYVEFPTYTMISNFEINPEADAQTVYNINYWANTQTQNIISDYEPIPGSATMSPTDDAVVIKLYPNPASNRVHVVIDTNTTYTVRIFNTLGTQLMIVNNYSNEMPIDISKLKAGVYFVKIEVGGKTETHKIIKYQ